IKAVSFTGSTQTGRRIAQSTAGSFKKISLEMGGKNPVLIFSDCNWSAMIETVVRSSFQNSGQICLCGSRILVEESSALRFEKDFSAAVQDLRLGDPLDREIRMGPLVSRQHYDKVWNFLQEARRLSARFVFGGTRGAFEKGFFLEPTLLTDLPDSCSLLQEEIFGPVVTLQTFRTAEEAIQLANASSYGLAGSLWTENASRAQSMARALEVGMLWINSWMVRDLRVPFGGWKNSGFGREGGEEALRFFTEVKSLYWHQS
ncbi:MAG: aldehyde dehydrogenase family protein, partial [Bdellovibrio sp.]